MIIEDVKNLDDLNSRRNNLINAVNQMHTEIEEGSSIIFIDNDIEDIDVNANKRKYEKIKHSSSGYINFRKSFKRRYKKFHFSLDNLSKHCSSKEFNLITSTIEKIFSNIGKNYNNPKYYRIRRSLIFSNHI